MNASIRWNEQEVSMVINRAARIILDGGAPMRGDNYSYSGLVNQAQLEVLSSERHRKYDNLKVSAKGSYSTLIHSAVNRIALERNNSSKSIKAETEVAVKATEVKVEAPKADEAEIKAEAIFLNKVSTKETLPELGLDLFVDSLAEQFRTKLRRALNVTAAEVLEEMSAVNQLTNVVPPRGAVEVSAPNRQFIHKIKVGVIGMIEGHDKTFIEKGLGDIYQFKYVDSPSKVSSLNNCEFALVRVKFVNHGLIEACKASNRDLKLIEVKGSASSVNDWLSNHYLTTMTNSD